MTVELVAAHGPAQESLNPVFEALDQDPDGSLDGIRDQPNMPADAEPEHVRRDLAALAANNQS